METPFTQPETYIKEFNSNDYLDTYYEPKKGAMKGEWLNFALKNLHETFTSGAVEGDLLIDIGSGPTIYHLLSAADMFKNIIISDFLPQNIAEVQKWLEKDPSAFNWSQVVKLVCELEGDSKNWERKEEKLRGVMKKILKCDVLKKNPFEPHVLPPADCILSCLCLEAPCKDLQTYCNVLKNLKDLLKPGGHLIVQSVLNCSFYFVGKKRFFCLNLTKEDIEKAFKEAGYEIKKMVVTPLLDKSYTDISEYDSHYFVLAQKSPIN